MAKKEKGKDKKKVKKDKKNQVPTTQKVKKSTY
jgi:hypothetical protein